VEAFKDLKSLLGLDKLMNKRKDYMEQMAALVMLAFAIGYLTGEAVRDELFDPQDETKSANIRRKWRQFSGLLLLLKRKKSLSKATWRRLLRQVLDAGVQISMDGEVYLKEYASPRDARRSLAEYRDFYNYRRLHQVLDYQTPAALYYAQPALPDDQLLMPTEQSRLPKGCG